MVDVGDDAEVPNFGLRHGGKIRAVGQRGSGAATAVSRDVITL
jgi:hypothetical protein